MKTTVWGAHLRSAAAAVEVAVAVAPRRTTLPRLRLVRLALRSTFRLISTACNNASSRSRNRSISIRIFAPALPVRCIFLRAAKAAAGAAAVRAEALYSDIASASAKQRSSSPVWQLTTSALMAISSYIARRAVAPAVDADRQIPTAGQGRLNVSLRMYLEPKEEFKQIFYEGWRIQRDYLYVPNMHGADWPKMKEMYGQLLPHVMHRADLNYLLDVMGSEISIGHSYVRGGDMPAVPPSPGGLLGADFTIDGGRYKIARIYDNESWNPDLRAPLAEPGLDVSTGDYVLAINGEELKAPDNIYRLLDGTANRQTVLTVNSRPAMDGARQVTVLPIANEQTLRTRAWVEANRRLVDKLSGGQLAYVYLPNTGQPGYTSFNRYYFAQQDKQGAIIDERFNGGGSAADYIIDVLQRDFDGYFNNVAGDRYPFTSPAAGIWGPKVMIINEMAGSGGDLMPWMFKHRKIGLLVGKRTWGGLVHTADTPPFIDGGSMIAPRGGFFSREGKWAVENEGVAPDIDVENWPKDVIGGHDLQLERAVQETVTSCRLRLLSLQTGHKHC
jgi:tricorn protease